MAKKKDKKDKEDKNEDKEEEIFILEDDDEEDENNDEEDEDFDEEDNSSEEDEDKEGDRRKGKGAKNEKKAGDNIARGESKTTEDHEEIKRWVEERGGKPSVVKGTESGKSGLLRINFPGYGGADRLEEISWERFFEIFDENRLAFLYQDELKSGEKSNFFKFVRRGK